MSTIQSTQTQVQAPVEDRMVQIWVAADGHPSTDPQVWRGLSVLACLDQRKFPGE